MREIPFEKLDTELSLESNQLDIQRLNVEVFGGYLSGSGRVDFATDDGPMSQTHYRLDQVDALQLFRAVGAEGHITGLMTGEGELTGRGKNHEKFKKSARGSADIELTNGMIRPVSRTGEGAAYHIPFNKISTHLSFNRNVLDIHSARIIAFGGVISGQGSADFSPSYGADYQVGCRMNNIDATKIFRVFGVTRDISGLLTLQG